MHDEYIVSNENNATTSDLIDYLALPSLLAAYVNDTKKERTKLSLEIKDCWGQFEAIAQTPIMVKYPLE